jgi:cysteine-rich repeat protein
MRSSSWAGVVAVALAVCAAASTSPAQTLGDGVVEAIDGAGTARVMVFLRSPVGPEAELAALQQAAQEVQDRVLASVEPADFATIHRYATVPALAGVLNANGLAALLASPDVDRIDLDLEGSGGLAQTVPHIRSDVLRNTYGYTGANVIVAVIDTGFDRNHPDLASTLVGEQCFCSDGTGCCPNGQPTQTGMGAAQDDHGHGTHVSGIVAGKGAGGVPVGVAPGAFIAAVKVLDDQNRGWFSDWQAGLDWVRNQTQLNIRVVNMSLGTFQLYPGLCNALFPATEFTVSSLAANGIPVFAASMNNGSASQMASPACISVVNAVGAVNDSDDVPGYSNSSWVLDLLAPGHAVTSARLGGGSVTFNGTSMASAHAAGVTAQLFSSGLVLPPPLLLQALAAGGVAITDGKSGITRPRIDAVGAFLAPICGNHRQDAGEQCDDGNLVSGDGCDFNCTPTGCGNRVVTAGEQCDAGTANGLDGCCSASCQRVDIDADGVCDRDDSCPHLATVTAQPMSSIKKVGLAYKQGGPGGGDDKPVVSHAVFQTGATFDPATTHTVHVTIVVGGFAVHARVFATSLPPGGLWSQPQPSRKKWTYMDRARPVAHQVRTATIRERPASSGSFLFILKGVDADIGPLAVPFGPTYGLTALEIRLEIEAAGSGVCFARSLYTCTGVPPLSSTKDVCYP